LGNQLTAWRVTDEEQREHKRYARYEEAVEEMFARTESEFAPWTIVAATDRRWTTIQVFETIIERLEPHVAPHEAPLPRLVEEQLQAIGEQDGRELSAPGLGSARNDLSEAAKATTDKTVGDPKDASTPPS
jgi:hypothetical protein